MRPWLAKLVRDLLDRRGPFLAVVVTTLLGVTLFGATYNAFRNLDTSYREMFVQLNFADLTIEGGDLTGFVEQARALEGVQSAATRFVREVPLEVGDERLIGRVVGTPTGEQPDVNQLLVLQGSYLAENSEAAVLVERHLADHFGLEPGDQVRIRTLAGWQSLEIQGVVASPEYVWPARSRQQLLTTPDTFGVLFAPPSLARGGFLPATRQALVYIDPAAERERLMERLQQLAADANADRVVTRAEQPSNALLQEDIEGFGQLAVLFPLLFLGAALVAAFVVITRLVQEQREAIGTLLASGVRRRAVLLHHLGFGLVPGALGASLGAVLGEVSAAAITGAYTSALDIPITVVRFRPEVALGGFAVATVLAGLAAAVPAYRASRTRPAVAMTGASRTTVGGPTLVERAVPALGRLPASVKLVLRSLGRHPGRSMTTALGVVLSLLLVMVSWGMLDTVQVLLDRQFEVIQRQDAEVFPATSPREAIEAISGVEGVASAEAVVAARGDAVAHGSRLDVGIRAFPAGTRMHGFRTPAGELRSLPAEGALVTTSLRDRLDLQPGDELQLRLSGYDASVSTTVADFVEEVLGTWVYLQRPVTTEAGEEISPTTVMVRLEATADPQATLEAIERLDSVAAVVSARSLEMRARDFMSLFYVFVGLMLALGAILGFSLIYAAMSVNVAERTRELATLRALGVSHRRLALIVTGENLLVAAVALIPGVPLAYFATAGFLASFNSPLFRYALIIQPWTWAIACASVLLAVLASQLPALRSVATLDLTKAVRTG